MNLFHLFVLGVIFITLCVTYYTGQKLKHKFTNMQAMIIAMVFGMGIGLTAGVLFGSVYQGNLYVSTLISIGIGLLGGLICGISFGLLPSVEGVLSGIMSGMMGAMLGEMITVEQSFTMMNIFLTFTTSSFLWFFIFSNDGPVEKRRWVVKPLLTFVMMLSILLLGNQLDKSKVIFNIDHNDKTKHYHMLLK